MIFEGQLTHKVAIQLHLVAESRTICSFRSRRQASPETFGHTLVFLKSVPTA
jgi:hypothetical protein